MRNGNCNSEFIKKKQNTCFLILYRNACGLDWALGSAKKSQQVLSPLDCQKKNLFSLFFYILHSSACVAAFTRWSEFSYLTSDAEKCLLALWVKVSKLNSSLRRMWGLVRVREENRETQFVGTILIHKYKYTEVNREYLFVRTIQQYANTVNTKTNTQIHKNSCIKFLYLPYTAVKSIKMQQNNSCMYTCPSSCYCDFYSIAFLVSWFVVKLNPNRGQPN